MSELPMAPNDDRLPFVDHTRGTLANSLAAKRLVRAVSGVAQSSNAATSEIRDATCAFVDELKALDVPPERVLVQFKEVIANALGDRRSDEQRQLFEQVITWCIEAYYRR